MFVDRIGSFEYCLLIKNQEMKPLQHFFDNKVKLVLQNKQIVKGLHKSTDYDKKTITLIQVQSWGSDKSADIVTVAANTKMQEKTYDIADIAEIEYEGSHFKDQQVKKYNKEDFFDNLGSSCTQNRPKYREKPAEEQREYRGGYRQGGYREGGYKQRQPNRDYRERNYNQKGGRREKHEDIDRSQREYR